MSLKEFVKNHRVLIEGFAILGGLLVGSLIAGACVIKNLKHYESNRLQKVTQFLSDNYYIPKTIEFTLERPEFGSGCIGMHQAFLALTIKNNNRVEVKGCCTDDFSFCHVIKEVVIE